MKSLLSHLFADTASVNVRHVELSAGHSEAELREKMARIVLDEMYQFVALLDHHGTLLEVNRAALEGAGIRLDDIMGKPFWEARWWRVSAETAQRQREACRTAAEGTFVRYDVEIYGEAAGEETIIIDYSLIPVKDRGGKVVFLLAEGRNITEKKRAEAEIARKNQELERLLAKVRELDEIKSQFFANVSHELRTPLALMLGPTERMLTSAGLAAAERRDVEVIRKNAFMLLKHVNDLLDLAKLDAGQMSLDYAEADLAELVRAMAGHFEALAPERDIAFAVRAPERIAAQADGAKVERIVLNLLSNAFKFTPQGGRITCAVEATEGGEAVVTVQDSGPGVPAHMRSAIFERFRQADGSATREAGGTGLGLAIAKDFVELHGGSIAVADAPGGGALFQVTLPLCAPEGTVVRAAAASGQVASSTLRGVLEQVSEFGQPAEAAPASAPSGAPLVLVVEDNADLRRFIVDTLSGSFELAVATDGEEGLRLALERRPDVVLTDIMMPRMSGDRMVEAMRREPALAELPILMLSAKADDALRIRLLRSGAQDYVVKPFSPEELKARVTNLASVKRAREVLQHELQSRQSDIETLAGDLASRSRALARAAEEARVAREHAEAAASVKSRFLAMASHELRSPLQNFELYLDLLRRTIESAGSGPSLVLGNLEDASRRMAHIVNSILKHSAVESGRMRIAPAETDLRPMLDDVVAELGERARGKGLGIGAEPGPPLVVETDPVLLRLVLVNLVDNAIKYTETGGVEVSLQDCGAEIRCLVRDTGPGIAAADQARVFEPFEQLGDVSHKHQPGVGLGLALVKNLLAALHGRVELSSAPGQGSTFTVVLPRRMAEAA